MAAIWPGMPTRFLLLMLLLLHGLVAAESPARLDVQRSPSQPKLIRRQMQGQQNVRHEPTTPLLPHADKRS